MTHIVKCIQGEEEPEDAVMAHRLLSKAKAYVIIEGKLYKYGVSALLKCITRK